MGVDKFLDELVKEQNGYIRLIDAQNKGVLKKDVLEYVRSRGMNRIAPGVYISCGMWEDRLFSLQLRNKNIIFSHETALFIHQLSSYMPPSPTISVARGYNAKHLKDKGVVVHTVGKEFIGLGITEGRTPAGNVVRMYDRERCICDIIKNRTRVNDQIFQTSLKHYFSNEYEDTYKLDEYAKLMKISNKVWSYVTDERYKG